MADYSGSFSGSFEGNGVLLRNIDYYNLKNLPRTITTFEGNSILANNALRNNFIPNVKSRLNAESVLSSSAQLIPEFDERYGNELNDNLVSGSSQIEFDGISNVPDGLVSSSAQIEITEAQISDLTHYTNSDVRSVMRDDSVVSSSAQVISHLPSGTISSSNQITITEAQISDLTHTDISGLNLFSGSIQNQVNSLTSVTSSYLTELPDVGIISSSAQVISHLPIGTISSSAQIEITEAQISDLTHTDVTSLNNFTSSVVLNSVTSSMSVATASFISDTFISESAVRSGFGQGSSDYTELSNVPVGIISSSAQISALGYSTTDNDNQTLSISGNTLTISDGNSVLLPAAGGGGGSSIWTTGSQDPEAYTSLMTQNNLQVTGSFDILGDLTVNGKSIFTQTSASDNESAVVIQGRLDMVERQIGGYIASASIKIGNTKDIIDCGGFF